MTNYFSIFHALLYLQTQIFFPDRSFYSFHCHLKVGKFLKLKMPSSQENFKRFYFVIENLFAGFVDTVTSINQAEISCAKFRYQYR